MQVSNSKTGMQDSNENNVKKVNKKMSNTKTSKSQKVATSSNTNSTPETYRESPQNVRLDTSESDEESVSEVKDYNRQGLSKFQIGWRKNFNLHRPSFDRLMCVNGWWCYLYGAPRIIMVNV